MSNDKKGDHVLLRVPEWCVKDGKRCHMLHSAGSNTNALQCFPFRRSYSKWIWSDASNIKPNQACRDARVEVKK